MPPSHNDVRSWNPETMASIANGIMRLQAHLEIEAPKAGNPVLDLTGAQWTGEARGPADDRAAGLTRWIRSVADEYGDLAAALRAGQQNIRGAMTALTNRTDLADADGYILDRGSREYTVNFDAARAPEGAEYDAGVEYEHHAALLALGTAADDAVTATRDAINSALGELGGMTPDANAVNRGVVDSSLAASDAAAVRTGTATPEQRGRFLRAMDLTPEQLEMLKAGQPSDLDPSRLQYVLGALGLAGMDPKSAAVTGALGALERRGSDIEDAYARQRRSVGQAGMSADDVARLNSVGKNVARGAFWAGIAYTFVDEGLKYSRDEQDGGDTAAAVVGAVGGGYAGGALAGAAIGSFAGPVGTAVGAGIGAALGSHYGASIGKWVKGRFD
ncbi:hypothetical protein IA539_04920 [Gordonia sp. zg691]|uniref:WXG100 family type VII secretion target n=1 Tax=Gordonia jinghuaiqii TaxID=2758710 RepID=A0A7D7LW36_9ACTN|nr:hypothetical protein [Gordonia jinghuaiqii]MBD0860550.1 hypothetical protein [Gordonia jinghuaiqii]MCR5978185.1 hypothetical protein [Gordonia jinghuaiqii]QMT01359.1 hypothetical protein H1R19_21475 [Gordonia jinghuaiqii]